jgi:condensin-2 complex subunit H2
MAKMDSVIIPEHTNAFEAQQSQQEEFHPSQSPPPYEKVLNIDVNKSIRV